MVAAVLLRDNRPRRGNAYASPDHFGGRLVGTARSRQPGHSIFVRLGLVWNSGGSAERAQASAAATPRPQPTALPHV